MRQLAAKAEELTGIPAARVLGRGRPADVALVRQAIIYLLRESTGGTLMGIGELFNRDHGTVIHAHRKVRTMLEVEMEGGPDAFRPTAAFVRELAKAADLEVPRAAKPSL